MVHCCMTLGCMTRVVPIACSLRDQGKLERSMTAGGKKSPHYYQATPKALDEIQVSFLLPEKVNSKVLAALLILPKCELAVIIM